MATERQGDPLITVTILHTGPDLTGQVQSSSRLHLDYFGLSYKTNGEPLELGTLRPRDL